MVYVINVVHLLLQILSILVIISAVLSFFMSPFHPIRQAVDRVVNPLLSPIRRVIPTLGAVDISPIVLLIIIQILDSLLLSIR